MTPLESLLAEAEDRVGRLELENDHGLARLLDRVVRVARRQQGQVERVARRGAGPLQHRLEAEQCIADCDRIAEGKT